MKLKLNVFLTETVERVTALGLRVRVGSRMSTCIAAIVRGGVVTLPESRACSPSTRHCTRVPRVPIAPFSVAFEVKSIILSSNN